jgi:ketosteroid isomerase-like protein
MHIAKLIAVATITLVAGCATPPPQQNLDDLKRQVADTERAFAKTMADRDHAAFSSFISEEAVFFAGTKVLHGKQEVIDGWKGLYAKPDAPFSWQPEQVEVLNSGTLALSSGPVRDPKGKIFAIYSSIWRLEAPNTWRIVFDKGSDVCDCAKP